MHDLIADPTDLIVVEVEIAIRERLGSGVLLSADETLEQIPQVTRTHFVRQARKLVRSQGGGERGPSGDSTAPRFHRGDRIRHNPYV